MSENKRVKNAVRVELDGIEFRSKLELRMYEALQKRNIDFKYESLTITVMDGFTSNAPFYMRKKTKKKDYGFINVAPHTIRKITYTPDFVFQHGKFTVLLEIKGFETEVYRFKRKFILKKLDELNAQGSNYILAQIKTLGELDTFLNLLDNGNIQ